ncbi:hypothetical protein [Alloacidobacterium sp.]|uniref:hypothetical protein n=1 Tax=Alloacidobacterium sp. TaxID=2951999 RepID=UPI002D3A31EB|nr:hypothetical protein [Alloacidobacterium sp.]HYK37479.1 hypothetical protein [Alloacidobacterium sp.]
MVVVMLPMLEKEAALRQIEAGKQQAARGVEGGRGKKKPLSQKVDAGVSDRNNKSEKFTY